MRQIKAISLTSPKSILLILPFIFFYGNSIAQSVSNNTKDSLVAAHLKAVAYYKTQRDLVDCALIIMHKDPNKRIDSLGVRAKRLHFSGAPSLEYTLTTGLAASVSGSLAFYTSGNKLTNISSILTAVYYTQNNQFFIPVQSSVWTKNNKFNLLGDYRFYKFPQDTYGFGGYTSLSDGYIVNYNYVRMYQSALKNVAKNLYIGFGFQFDYHWNISEELTPTTKTPTDFEKYGFSNTSTSSGIALDFLYDTRKNSLNPEGGSFYSNIVFRQNLSILGSNTNWNSLLVDVRKYIKVSDRNILAFWSYNYFSLSGNPPYLDLPGTASDTYSNTGRGYIQDRFIGKNMVDLEAEFRYAITRNGLLGGVIFANAESLSELNSNRFEVISPAIGAGLRIKFNKFSHTNICIDYGIGMNGSRGLFTNLGEVF